MLETAAYAVLLLGWVGCFPGGTTAAGTISRGAECPIVAGVKAHGFHYQPTGPFVALITSEDALGSQLGVMYYRPLGAPAVGPWTLTDRFWQDPEWASDVTSICWSGDNRLFVGTSGVYGDGGLFELDLLDKKARRLHPRKDRRCATSTCVTTILGFDAGGALRVNLDVYDRGDHSSTSESVDVSRTGR